MRQAVAFFLIFGVSSLMIASAIDHKFFEKGQNSLKSEKESKDVFGVYEELKSFFHIRSKEETKPETKGKESNSLTIQNSESKSKLLQTQEEFSDSSSSSSDDSAFSDDSSSDSSGDFSDSNDETSSLSTSSKAVSSSEEGDSVAKSNSNAVAIAQDALYNVYTNVSVSNEDNTAHILQAVYDAREDVMDIVNSDFPDKFLNLAEDKAEDLVGELEDEVSDLESSVEKLVSSLEESATEDMEHIDESSYNELLLQFNFERRYYQKEFDDAVEQIKELDKEIADMEFLTLPATDHCTMLWDCGSCTSNPDCGWCETTRRCSFGTGKGPAYGACPHWSFIECDETSQCSQLNSCSVLLNILKELIIPRETLAFEGIDLHKKLFLRLV